jgi:putative ABC transport system substrate-binding protein
VTDDPFLISHPDQLVALAARHRIPTIYPLREFVKAGGLISYGPNITEAYGKSGFTSGGFSAARRSPICRCKSRRSLNLFLI